MEEGRDGEREREKEWNEEGDPKGRKRGAEVVLRYAILVLRPIQAAPVDRARVAWVGRQTSNGRR